MRLHTWTAWFQLWYWIHMLQIEQHNDAASSFFSNLQCCCTQKLGEAWKTGRYITLNLTIMYHIDRDRGQVPRCLNHASEIHLNEDLDRHIKSCPALLPAHECPPADHCIS